MKAVFTPLNIALVCLCVFVSAASVIYKGFDMFTGKGKPILSGIDDTMYYVWLRSAVMDHDLNFANDIRLSNTLDAKAKNDIFHGPRTATGLIPDKYWIGEPLLNAIPFLPAYWISGFLYPNPTGYEPVFFDAIWLFQLGLAVASIVFCFLIIRRFVQPQIALTATLTMWLASPLVYYQTARVSMPHNQLFFLVTLIYLLTFRIMDRRDSLMTAAVIGLLSGLAFITRATSIFYLLFPAWAYFIYLRENPSQAAPRIGLAAAAFVPPLLVQLIAWKQLYGSWFVYSYHGESFDFSHPQILGILFSNLHGLLNWHPLLLLGLIPFFASAFTHRGFRLVWVVVFALLLYVNASWWDIGFGSAFGNRAFEGVTLFAMFGLAGLIQGARSDRMRYLLSAVCLVAILWNLQLLAGWFAETYSRTKPVPYAERWLPDA